MQFIIKLYFQTYYMNVNELQALYCNIKSIYFQKKLKYRIKRQRYQLHVCRLRTFERETTSKNRVKTDFESLVGQFIFDSEI